MTSTLFAALEAGQLDPTKFRHSDHVICAFEALSQTEFFDALARFAGGLQRLTEKAGAPEKFNATVTYAFMSMIAERMDADTETAADFLAENPDLLAGKALSSYYSADQLTGPLARRVALLPRRSAALLTAGCEGLEDRAAGA